MLPLGGAAETPKNHELVRVVPRVPDGDVPKKMAVRSQKLICPGPHLLPLTTHNPRPLVPRPGFAAQEKVRGHILQLGGHNGR